MNSLDHLAESDLFWINLNRSRDRARKMRAHVTSLFERDVRIEAVDSKNISTASTITFVEGWQQLWDQQGALLSIANTPPGRKFRVETQKANVAIKYSHLKAIETAMNVSRNEWFFIGEDDIVPRSTVLAGEVPEPPDDADVAIWSGGVPMNSFSVDDNWFASGTPHRWHEVTKKGAMNCLGAGLYEIRGFDVAEKMLETATIPMSWDHAWGFAFKQLKVYRLKANAFAQSGVSVRNGKNREPVTVR